MPVITVKKINRLYVAFKQERQAPDSVVFGPRGQVQFYANGNILPTEQYSVSYHKEIAIGQYLKIWKIQKMNKSQYDQSQSTELNEAIDGLVEQFPQLIGREVRLRLILTKLQHGSASNTRAYELLGLRDSDELHRLWGVSMRRVTAHCQTLHERFGVGRKFGKTWVLTADEAERHRPAAKAGRPKANLKNT